MKTENNNSGDPIWTQNVELLTQEECLPVIGSSQVSSILQHLDPSMVENGPQNMDLIILPTTDFKLPVVENPFTLTNSYIVLKENGETKPDNSKNTNDKTNDNLKSKKDNYEDMLYYVCNLCPFLCIKDTKINEHLENAHKNKTVVSLQELKCPACRNIFYHRMSLRSHLIHDHGVGNSDISSIIQAIVYYSNKNKKKEKQKSPIRNTSDKLTLNSNVEDNPPPTDVSKQNPPKTIFDSVIKVSEAFTTSSVDTTKSTQCPFTTCKIIFPDAEKLNHHISCHADTGFACFNCGEKFNAWKPLTSHMWRLHKIDMGLYACDQCDYKTYSLAKLNNIHKLIHGDAKNFSCDVCNKAFKNNKQLRNHKLTHKEKSLKLTHICDECSKGFSDRRQLRIHLDIVHKKLKPFLCNFCGYKGSSRSSLKMHIRQHTGEKPFSCTVCSYTTSDHNSLRRHNLRHTGQKPYKCTYCTYACIQSSTYKTHLKTKHPGMEKDLMFTCVECQFRSVNRDVYMLHMVTVHNIKPQAPS
ncbi:oocyte zinc finger protein XlCOF6-like isoform X1 [Diorhabda carinulata]|uniref:oocyte zinc finger protein XlCOF6-like isoform X1 n=1 Tax=Diorhabda carinulata TaxID=1163345 RepID=UPI00259FEB4F|nr:oocyte zinc finger protein XlCOF6-like isoform X1 [Diorhabda carinulata]